MIRPGCLTYRAIIEEIRSPVDCHQRSVWSAGFEAGRVDFPWKNHISPKRKQGNFTSCVRQNSFPRWRFLKLRVIGFRWERPSLFGASARFFQSGQIIDVIPSLALRASFEIRFLGKAQLDKARVGRGS